MAFRLAECCLFCLQITVCDAFSLNINVNFPFLCLCQHLFVFILNSKSPSCFVPFIPRPIAYIRSLTCCRPRILLHNLVQILSALLRPTRARYLYVLEGELVVVGKLLPLDDAPKGEDDDVLVAQYVDDLRVAVWLARVVDEARRIATHRCVHDKVLVDFEHVAADAPTVVVPFPFVRQGGADQFAGILDDHFASLNVPIAEQPTSVDVRPVHPDRFLGGLL